MYFPCSLCLGIAILLPSSHHLFLLPSSNLWAEKEECWLNWFQRFICFLPNCPREFSLPSPGSRVECRAWGGDPHAVWSPSLLPLSGGRGMKGERLVLCRWSWSDGEGATIIAHLTERPAIITVVITTCIIPGSMLDILDILMVTKHFWVLLFCFIDEKTLLIEVRYLPTVTELISCTPWMYLGFPQTGWRW